MTTATTTPREMIERYLNHNGVTPAWRQSAMQRIQAGLSGNRWFVASVRRPRLTVRDGYVARFSCDAEVVTDSGKSTAARLRYIFQPTARVAHRVRLIAK